MRCVFLIFSETYNPNFDEKPLNQRPTYQLTDINDAKIQKLLENAERFAENPDLEGSDNYVSRICMVRFWPLSRRRAPAGLRTHSKAGF